MLPSTQSLRVFEACSRTLNCTRAGEELALTAGAVSKQVRMLEDTLGLRLFERLPQGLALTPAGAQYIEHTRSILLQLEQAAWQARSVAVKGQMLRLHVLPSLAERWLLPRFGEFQKRHPSVTVQFTTQAKGSRRTEQPDASFRYGTGVWSKSQSTYLTGKELLLVASPSFLSATGEPDSARDAARFAKLEHFELPGAWADFFQQHGVRRPQQANVVRYGFFSVLIRSAVMGMGLALVPSVLVREELQCGALVNPAGLRCVARCGYFLVWPARQHGSPALAAFRDWVESIAER
jgi:LysR family transcriptional regulator, glycine cleavage system transcriptional activator